MAGPLVRLKLAINSRQKAGVQVGQNFQIQLFSPPCENRGLAPKMDRPPRLAAQTAARGPVVKVSLNRLLNRPGGVFIRAPGRGPEAAPNFIMIALDAGRELFRFALVLAPGRAPAFSLKVAEFKTPARMRHGPPPDVQDGHARAFWVFRVASPGLIGSVNGRHDYSPFLVLRDRRGRFTCSAASFSRQGPSKASDRVRPCRLA